MAEAERKIAGKCPWCEKRKGEIDGQIKALDKEDPMYKIVSKELAAEKERVNNATLVVTHKPQCTSCGKYWDAEAIGKPYSLELERGAAWAREQEIKRLKGL